MTKILTIVGARPQFIKAVAVSRAIQKYGSDKVRELIVHTGQHYDENMSDVFFDQLKIPRPSYSLNIAGGGHGSMTGRMLEAIESVCEREKPDWVLVYGDTNSTLAGALAAAKLQIPVAHVEAGLRSYNMRMPEELNRVMTDHISSRLFCPTEVSVKNLAKEGLTDGVSKVGDVMFDVAIYFRDEIKKQCTILQRLDLHGVFVLATCHRAENTDDPEKLESIMTAMDEIAGHVPVVFPIHPRTRKLITEYGLSKKLKRLIILEPLSFFDMLTLEQAASIILTDSGGVQKEAFFYGVPCITMRDETEWLETVELGSNKLVGTSTQAIVSATLASLSKGSFGVREEAPYGDGTAGIKIIENILRG